MIEFEALAIKAEIDNLYAIFVRVQDGGL